MYQSRLIEESLYNDDYVDQGLLDHIYTDEEGPSSSQSPFQLLRTSDYNLNSPLIEDSLKLMLEWLITNRRPRRYRKQTQKPSDYDLFKKIEPRVDWLNVQGGSSSVNIVFSNLSSRMHGPQKDSKREFVNLSTILKSLEDLEEIPRMFLEIRGIKHPFKVLTRLLTMNTEDKFSRYISNMYFNYFLFHHVSLFMNSLDFDELKNLLVQFDRFKLIEGGQHSKTTPNPNFLIEVISPFWGKILFSKEYLFFPRLNLFMDKNQLLMIKDIFLSRFNSLLVILTDDCNLYSKNFGDFMIDIYKTGDSILSSLGTRGYEVIKLLEPSVLEKLVFLSESHRDKIPHLGDFEAFLGNKRRELIAEFGLGINKWFHQLSSSDDPDELGFIYGCYRHWGHPFIDYRSGLKKLYDQVHIIKEVDKSYVESLASDLAFKILQWGFNKYSRWALDSQLMPRDHILYDYVVTQTWPPNYILHKVIDTWHLLPITPIFQVPESMDPSEILDDKSHSINRSELIDNLQKDKYSPIQSKKVIITALSSEPIKPLDFLHDIDINGLKNDDLIIGLKPKERELKIEGRFFALMSWNLRLYFVLTEKLLSDHIVPLFDALTMTDNLTKVFKKLIDRVEGHGLNDYSRVTWSFHLDYEKWNNHQRYESTSEIFLVLDKFFGFRNLFCRTHEFFENSWIYYADRPDLINVEDDQIVTRDPSDAGPVCWNGQLGGLEGLRQKGWSLVSLLMIEREARSRNTQTKILAQGDNQVLCPTYNLSGQLSEEDLDEELRKISLNATSIFTNVKEGAKKLGLIIKGEETMCSHDFLVYGKIMLYRGNILVSESKRWSRVSCVSNDQVINLANIMSTVSTNCLTVAQNSQSIIKPLKDFLLLSVIAIFQYLLHSPILKRQVSEVLALKIEDLRVFFARAIFVDPSLGGVSGMSLGRLHVRQFPDPVTEGLSFWKEIHGHTRNQWIKRLAHEAGNPEFGLLNTRSLIKLIEDPSSLNLKGNTSPSVILRNIIRDALYSELPYIKNSEFKSAISLSKEYREEFVHYLFSITPVFPRFISELYSSSFLGISESVIGLIQNSRTIRKQFKANFNKLIGQKFQKAELDSVKTLVRPLSKFSNIWTCSASQADQLRKDSWRTELIGTTIPHPSEMLKPQGETSRSCQTCCRDKIESPHLSITVLHSFSNTKMSRGPLKGYLGSATSSTTQIFHSWEKITNVHVVKRSLSLREAINWFVREGSNVAQTIRNNMISLLGEDAPQINVKEFQRTGSAIHRFHSSRCSEGGYSSTAPNLLSYISVSSDTMSDLTNTGKNFDFMFQPLMLYCQSWTSESVNLDSQMKGETYHWHLECRQCIREIFDVELESSHSYKFPDMSVRIQQMTPGIKFKTSGIADLQFIPGNFDGLSQETKSRHIGIAQGLLFGILVITHDHNLYDTALFPVNIFSRLSPRPYLRGLLKGIVIGSALGFLSRMTSQNLKHPKDLFFGVISLLIAKLSTHPGLCSMLKSKPISDLIRSSSHKITPSYPTTIKEGNSSIITHLYKLLKDQKDNLFFEISDSSLWVFSDFRTPQLSRLTAISHKAAVILTKMKKKLSKQDIHKLNNMATLMRYCLREDQDPMFYQRIETLSSDKQLSSKIFWVNSEVRHAAKSMKEVPSGKYDDVSLIFGKEWIPTYEMVTLHFSVLRKDIDANQISPDLSRQRKNPLISGLRLVQVATGAHYKLKPILTRILKPPDLAMSIGDGSGGISSLLLRMFPDTYVIFNSLLDWSEDVSSGSVPLPPSAIASLDKKSLNRVVGYGKEWERPNDLRLTKTWETLHRQVHDSGHNLELIICDAEVTDIDSTNTICENLCSFVKNLNSKSDLKVVFKTYMTMIMKEDYQVLGKLASCFSVINAIVSQVSSTNTSEIYLECSNMSKVSYDDYHISLISLIELSGIVKSLKSQDEEFERALTINRNLMLQGFPESVIPDPTIELTETLLIEGMDSILVSRFMSDLSQLKDERQKLLYLLSLIPLYSNIKINISRPQSGTIIIPNSNPELSSHFNSIHGMLFYIAWITKNICLFKTLDNRFNQKMCYSYYMTKRGSEKYLSWDWSLDFHISKMIPSNSNISKAGHWIRVFTKLINLNPSNVLIFSLREISFILKKYNKNLSCRTVETQSPLFSEIKFVP